ncbi:MAG: hypothetical protein UR43_C0028G0005 [candidate division TM6 bacterium GW2011_GWF2_33_332]|nr:MAG: hypothetical protein UR43_C0028G0005 [candidate division TM6 bacterium GW2011_GWF2_33_332]
MVGRDVTTEAASLLFLLTKPIKMSNKLCSEPGCIQPLYARGWCINHYKQKYLKPKEDKKVKKTYVIPHRTEDRAKEERQYSIDRKLFIEDERAKDPQGRIFCIFCQGEIGKEPDCHHLDGRDEDKLLNKDDWSLAHHKCHMDYDSMPWRKLIWWMDYIKNIKISHPHIYQKELRKMEK